MAEMEQAVRTRLLAVAAVTALAGSRIHYVRLPQGSAYPAASLQRISRVEPSAMGSDSGVVFARLQVTSWHPNYLQAKALATAVRVGLKRFRGTVDGVEIQDVFLDTENDIYEPAQGDAGAYGVASDYRVIWRE